MKGVGSAPLPARCVLSPPDGTETGVSCTVQEKLQPESFYLPAEGQEAGQTPRAAAGGGWWGSERSHRLLRLPCLGSARC